VRITLKDCAWNFSGGPKDENTPQSTTKCRLIGAEATQFSLPGEHASKEGNKGQKGDSKNHYRKGKKDRAC